MPDLLNLILRWRQQIIAVMLLSLISVGVITFLKPDLYLSIATAVPASSFANDKAKIFNENIQGLYSTLGTADDLDKIIGTANLDTPYLAVAAQFNLFDHYKVSEKGDAAVIKAASLLKENTKVMKSEYGELKVKVWDTDKKLAPQLANALLQTLQTIHQDIQSAGNQATLQGLKQAKERINPKVDTTFSPEDAVLNKEKKRQYDKLIEEYQLVIDTKPLVLVTVEKAKEAIKPDKPKRIQILIVTALLSFLFSLLAALVLERRKPIPE